MEQIRSVISSTPLDNKMDKLRNKARDLDSKKEDIEEQLKNEEISSPSVMPRKAVKRWLENVENTSNKVRRLEQEVSQSGMLKRLFNLAEKDVDECTKEVMDLIEEGKFSNGLTIEAYEHEGVPFQPKELVGETFERNKKMLLDCLIRGDNPIIGVYGMGGVGKTTLLSHIHDELLANRVSVYWVTVSQNCSIHKLQGDIAKKMKLDISDENDERIRAAKLAWALVRRENFVLILDDVWEPISLDQVGIRVGADGRKLILTTRSLEVCRKMKCQKQIKVQPLNPSEAWTLFKKTLGNETPLLGEIEEIAESLVEECDGLPLGVATVAGSMKGVDDTHEWRNALEEIREAKYRNGDMEFSDVFCVLKHSYDKLKDPVIQECLLYCSLFPEDALIRRDELIEYFIDEKLIDGWNNRDSKIDKGHVILNKLVNVCLLGDETDFEQQKCVKMHDLIRDMAIKIASSRFLVRAGMGLENIPINEEWSDDLVRVSLMNNDISDIPFNASPKCPRLLTLLLHRNPYFDIRFTSYSEETSKCFNIPDDFFVHMKMLSVLDLSHTSIKSLPTSIVNLESLTSLLLGGCHELRYIPPLANLTALRRVDLSHTGIEEVPEGMEKLINLRYLNLNQCRRLKMIPNGILSALSNMEYFTSDTRTVRGEEIANWRKLETLLVIFDHIADLETCCKSWQERGPNNCTIIVGCDYDQFDPDGDCIVSGKEVYLSNVEIEKDRPVWATWMRTLSLESCRFESLSHIAKSSKALRECSIIHCESIRHVICSCCCDVLFSQSLESLELEMLPMLTDLIEREKSPSSVLPINAFSSLKELKISECDGLKRLFTPTQLSHLHSLETLKVDCCEGLVEIIGETLNQEATLLPINAFSSLKELSISHCNGLKRLFTPAQLSHLHSLETLWVNGCEGLVEIIGETLNQEATLLPINAFSSLKELSISHCNGLKRLFTPAQLSHLHSLETLELKYCRQLVEIIGETSDQEATTTVISSPPRLRHLLLVELPELKSFCSCSIKIPTSLEEIKIKDCEKLTRITLFWEEPYPPASLKSLKVQNSWWDSSLAWKHP